MFDESEPAPRRNRDQYFKLTPPLMSFIFELVLKLAELLAALAFQVYGNKLVAAANQANEHNSEAISRAVTSNQFALLAVCLMSETLVSLPGNDSLRVDLNFGLQTDEIASICSRVVAGAVTAVPSAASSLFFPLPETQTTPVYSTTITSYTTTTLLPTDCHGTPVITTVASVFTTIFPIPTNTSTTFVGPQPTEVNLGPVESNGLSAGAIVGFVVLAVLLVLLRVMIYLWSRISHPPKRRWRKRDGLREILLDYKITNVST
ncbi:hypothetical protein H2200_003992 [Cladophialophora chaetospira]|uniref:Uncharacterized protein n=1 Tax=Cladophialophora chaetospira TaxID=386627 RepID=A0AA39CL90_9EURO|nr:hypothetical protein H2200_003992 [Cladophialophora chaetospira]